MVIVIAFVRLLGIANGVCSRPVSPYTLP